MESTRAMTRQRSLHAESKNCKILLFLTADRRFDRKVKCPTGWASSGSNSPLYRSCLTRVKCLGGVGGMDGFGIDWYVSATKELITYSQQKNHHPFLDYQRSFHLFLYQKKDNERHFIYLSTGNVNHPASTVPDRSNLTENAEQNASLKHST